MGFEPDLSDLDAQAEDEAYFEEKRSGRGFDARLLKQPLSALPSRSPIILASSDSATDAMRAMQAQHRGCVLVTEDGTDRSPLKGIFTERDVLLKIIDRGRNPATVELQEVMTPDPEALPHDATVAWVLNKMEVGGFRHVPAVDEAGRPCFVVSVRDVVGFLVEAFPEEILNLPPEYGAKRYTTRDGA